MNQLVETFVQTADLKKNKKKTYLWGPVAALTPALLFLNQSECHAKHLGNWMQVLLIRTFRPLL